MILLTDGQIVAILPETASKNQRQREQSSAWHTLNKTKRTLIIDDFNYTVARLRLFFNITADQYGGVLGEYRRVNDAFSV